ncbi:MAG: 50S ribosomal protein L4 [Deltaproteobacteria bacterium]|nr:50S ribosomal protein L4 [Deltaproteobacteria bacterium]
MANFDVYDLANKKVGDIDLDDAIFAAPLRRYLLTEIIHWQRAKRRRGTKAQLTKGQVNKTTKKPFKQKGTGNARQGDWKSPHHVGGGVAFAARTRDYSYHMPKAKRRAALATALSVRVAEGGLKIVKDFQLDEIKTKAVISVLAALEGGNTLIVDGENEFLKKSVRNIPKAKYLHHDGINVYDILNHPGLVITESAANAIQQRLLGPTDEG